MENRYCLADYTCWYCLKAHIKFDRLFTLTSMCEKGLIGSLTNKQLVKAILMADGHNVDAGYSLPLRKEYMRRMEK